MSLMIIKCGIPEAFRGALTNAKEFLVEIEKRFAKNDKVKINTLLRRLIRMNYKCKGNINEYIMEMSNIASKLKALKFKQSDDLLVHLVLIQFQICYNCQKEKLTLNELISYGVHEEERMKHNQTESGHLASTSKGEDKKRKKDKEVAKDLAKKKQSKDNDNCFFCGKLGHVKKDCVKYHAWRVKKGLFVLPKSK